MWNSSGFRCHLSSDGAFFLIKIGIQHFRVYWVKLYQHLSQMTQIITNVLGKAAENLRHKRSFPAKRRGLEDAAFLRPDDAVPHGCSTDEHFFTSQRLLFPPGESRACRIYPRSSCQRSAVCHRLRRAQIPLPRLSPSARHFQPLTPAAALSPLR